MPKGGGSSGNSSARAFAAERFGKCTALIQRRSWQVSRQLSGTRLQRFIKMYSDDLIPNGDEDPDQVDPWVQAQLSTAQIRWLNNQGSAMKQGDLLKSALAEWVV